jgi:osmotically-inducible protein OsmY
MDRAGDEVRSWFGDEDAERRRQLDDRDRYRDRAYGQSSEYGQGSYRGTGNRDWSESSSGDRNSSYDRGYSGGYGYGDRGYGTRNYGNGEYGNGDYGNRDYSNRDSNRDYSNRDYSNRDYMSSGRSGSNYWSGSGTSYRGNAGYGEDPRRIGSYSGEGGYPGSFRNQGGFESSNRESFAGRGPKGYQRSDARINEDVCDRLCDSPDIDATNVDVRVNGGEVTLSGTVSSRDEKRRAEDMIENVSGVREVHNNLRVGRGDEASSSWQAGQAQGATGATSTTGSSGSTGNAQGANETPGSTLGLTGQPDKTSTAGRR